MYTKCPFQCFWWEFAEVDIQEIDMAPVSTLRLCKDWNHLIFNAKLTPIECSSMILGTIAGINIKVGVAETSEQ